MLGLALEQERNFQLLLRIDYFAALKQSQADNKSFELPKNRPQDSPTLSFGVQAQLLTTCRPTLALPSARERTCLWVTHLDFTTLQAYGVGQCTYSSSLNLGFLTYKMELFTFK